MSLKPAKEELFKRKVYPLLYQVKNKKYHGPGKALESRSTIFYIMAAIAVFLCAGILLNIGLNIYNMNRKKQILEINELLLIEKERSDRIRLKIAVLKGPERIMFLAQTLLEMHISDNVKIMYIKEKNLNTAIEANYTAEEKPSDNLGSYDNFLATIHSIEDIVMVVSEGVLTFFIP